jgi:hypothetical protein
LGQPTSIAEVVHTIRKNISNEHLVGSAISHENNKFQRFPIIHILSVCHLDVLIVLADEGYRVRALAPAPPVRSWLKVSQSKLACMAELRFMSLLTPAESDEAFDDNTGVMLVFKLRRTLRF